jgi:hypothetical protein
MSGETLEDYFRRLNLDETRRKILKNIKQGKREENGIDEHYLYVNRKEYSPIARDWYSIYMKRFTAHHRQRRARRLLAIDRVTVGNNIDELHTI